MTRDFMPVWRTWIGSTPLPPIPNSIIGPHERQAQRNHGQSLDRLAERGGLSSSEAVAIIEDRDWHSMSDDEAANALAALVAT